MSDSSTPLSTGPVDNSGESVDSGAGQGAPGAELRPGEEPAAADVDERIDEAARQAVGRARSAAREAGFRPGAGGRPTSRRRRRAVPVEFSSARPDGRDPISLGVQLERLVAERGWQAEVAVGSVAARWPAVVGPEVAQHVRPESFEDGVLVVRTDSTGWATNVRMFVPQWLEMLQAQVGAETIADLRVLGPAAPTWRKGRRSAPGSRGPRDTYG